MWKAAEDALAAVCDDITLLALIAAVEAVMGERDRLRGAIRTWIEARTIHESESYHGKDGSPGDEVRFKAVKDAEARVWSLVPPTPPTPEGTSHD